MKLKQALLFQLSNGGSDAELATFDPADFQLYSFLD